MGVTWPRRIDSDSPSCHSRTVTACRGSHHERALRGSRADYANRKLSRAISPLVGKYGSFADPAQRTRWSPFGNLPRSCLGWRKLSRWEDPDCNPRIRSAQFPDFSSISGQGGENATRRETGQPGRKPRDGPSQRVLPGLRRPRVGRLHNFASDKP